jgi:cytosine/uracil/thiamine/allantoin permease
VVVSDNLKNQVTKLFQVHVWLGAIIGVLLFWYIIKKTNENR